MFCFVFLNECRKPLLQGWGSAASPEAEPPSPHPFLPPSGIARPGPLRRKRSRSYARLRAAPHGSSAPPGGAVGKGGGATLRAAGREFRRRRQRAEGSRPGAGRAGAGRRWVLGLQSERATRRLRTGPLGGDRPHSPGSFLFLSRRSRRRSPVPGEKPCGLGT